MAISPKLREAFGIPEVPKEQPEPEPEPPEPSSTDQSPPPPPPPSSIPAPILAAAPPQRGLPPQNIAAEMSVLGSVLLDNETYHVVNKIVHAQDFYRESHRLIFQAMAELAEAGQPIDAITLTNVIRQRNWLQVTGGPTYIAELAAAVPTSLNAEHYARIVRDYATKRLVAQRASHIAALACDGVSGDALVGELDRLIGPIISGEAVERSKALPEPQSADEWFHVETERFAKSRFIWDGILEAGGVGICTGKKGFGKSTFARWLALGISRGVEVLGRATERMRVLYIDLEPGGRGRLEVWKALGWCQDDWLDQVTAPPMAGHPDVFKWLRTQIEKRGYGLVVIDTMFKLLRIDGANEYDKGLYAQVPIEQLARETGACFLMLHHARKNSFSDAASVAESILGATSIAGAASACFLINRRKNNVHTFRMDPPRYGNGIEGEIVLVKDLDGRLTDGGQWRGKWVNMAKTAVLEAAQKEPDWFGAAELEVVDAETGERMASRTVRWALKALTDDGVLERKQEKSQSGKGRPKYLYRARQLPVSPAAGETSSRLPWDD